jgi:hypothetical protein
LTHLLWSSIWKVIWQKCVFRTLLL